MSAQKQVFGSQITILALLNLLLALFDPFSALFGPKKKKRVWKKEKKLRRKRNVEKEKGGEYLERKTIFFGGKEKQVSKRKKMFGEGRAYKIPS